MADPFDAPLPTSSESGDVDALDTAQVHARSARAFDELLEQYRSMSDSQRMKGSLFEQLVRQYLLNDAQMRLEFADVHLWKDWPGNQGLPDTGVDLVGILRGNGDAVDGA